VQAVIELALHGARMTGFTSFNYEDSWTLWRELLPEYRNRVCGIARRSDVLSLGHYTLAEFKEFYAGLLAIAAAHDHLCFRWQRERGVYPVASAVMVRSQDQWIMLLSELASITKETCGNMIRDLSFDAEESLDLHLTPFVALDSLNLALAPQFPLHSLMDENILRICSRLRPNVFDATTLEKELESLLDLEKRLPGRNLQGPIKMPEPIPDIDLLITDETSSTIVIAELKWIAKSIAPRQIVTKNNEVAHGMSQLKQIREFLSRNPLHLTTQKKLAKSVKDYEHIYFLLVARDHWLWIEPADGIAIVEFEAFSKALQRTLNLNQALIRFLPMNGCQSKIAIS
jgi:hypothetical protein